MNPEPSMSPARRVRPRTPRQSWRAILAPVLLGLGILATPVPTMAARDSAPPPVGPVGYYRYPAVHGNTVVFTAEGDLWMVPIEGGVARRLTTHLGEESRAAISPDGKWVAFTATYEGPAEAYVMPIGGGLPKRLTWDGLAANVEGWTPRGEVMIATRRHSTLPAIQLVTVDPANGRRTLLPLAQAAEGAWDGRTLVFTRQEPNFSTTRRYRGGLLQQLWVWNGGREEAHRLMPSDTSGSRNPMVWQGRIYFVGDRDLDMNLWSVRPDGSDAQQLTRHRGWDVMGAALSDGRIVYQLGADLRVYDIAAGTDAAIPVRLSSDYDQVRERWVTNPMDFVTSAHVSPNGDRVVLTARGQVFVAPLEDGRLVEATRESAVRWRNARFLPDGKSLVGLSDASDEVEFWTLPANGVGDAKQVTRDATVLRWDGVPSPDGKWLAHWNKDQELWLTELANGRGRRIATCEQWDDFRDVSWSPDSRWLLYVRPAPDLLTQVMLYDTKNDRHTALTTDRWDSWSPTFDPGGQWIWFLSDRQFASVVPTMWGSRQPEPFFDKPTKVYGLPLQKGLRSPWAPLDELHGESKADDKQADGGTKATSARSGAKAADAKPSGPAPVEIDLDGLAERLIETPVPAGNYQNLQTDGKRFYLLSRVAAIDSKPSLVTFEIARKNDGLTTSLDGVSSYELSADRKKVLARKADAFYVFDAGAKAPDKLDKAKLPLGAWRFAFDPRVEWLQMFNEGWRLERDYFYDRNMHGVDWKGLRTKFRPLAERVTTRAELNDVFVQMMGELSALHMYVRGGDQRKGDDPAEPASLGAALERDEAAGGFRIRRIFRGDPDQPDRLSPLARPELDVRDGDIVVAVNGTPAASVADLGELLRGQAGDQVLLSVKRGSGAARDVIVEPVTPSREFDLRYTDWEYTRRLAVDSLSAGRVGYVHLRAMGSSDMAQWTRDYYPVFQREGLVVDVRRNNGGSIDAWILSRLIRRAWFWWQPRVGNPFANMPWAFRGKMAVIVDERTVSDGEAFAEGFRRLGLGKVIGTRTWGGEIWLSSSNFLVDRGIATAAETGTYGPDGEWYIEGRGVEPDIVVDNLPVETAAGRDAQLEAAVKHLLAEIARDPNPTPAHPAYPDKSDRRR